MPEAIALGPLVLPVERLGTLLLLFAAVWFTKRQAAAGGHDPARAGTVAELLLLIGISGARLGFAFLNWAAYREAPWTVLYLWQPGFLPVAGFAAAAVAAPFLLRGARQAGGIRTVSAGFAVAALLLTAFSTVMDMDFGTEALRPGAEVPNIRLVNLDGAEVELEQLRGTAVVLNFWASWCGPCRREMPALDAVQRDWENRGATVVGINVGENPQTAAEFMASIGVDFPVWLDGPGGDRDRTVELHERYGGPGLPSTLFIRPDGTLHSSQVGELSRGLVHSRLSAMLP